jgi:peptide/nickel transport system permease protein
MIGLALLIIYILAAVFADYIAPYGYTEMTRDYLKPPSAAHIFGTDEMGRDLLSRVVYGARYSLFLGFGATVIGVVLGMFFGCLAGYYGGKIDEITMRVTDVIQSVPSVLLNMALSVAFGAGLFNTMLALGFSIIASVCRLQRSAILNVRRMEYIDAATSVTCSDARIAFKHIIPNSFSSILVFSTMEIGHVIMMASGLSFLGLGVQPPIPEWGALLADGRGYMTNAPYLCICPGIVLVFFVLAINLFGDGLRDALDPKLKK